MDFLRCIPTVFVIGNEYEILINVCENGICAVKIGEELYYEENTGTLSSEKNYAKIRVPQSALDAATAYEIVYRRSVQRKAYYSELGGPQRAVFPFKPLRKTENIHLYHIADVHYRFELAKKTASFFGNELDVLLVNGDIGEVETEQDYFEVCRFVGDISEGQIPVVFVRGNHDTRGKLAERFTDYFPANGKNTYFTFELGCLRGIALDCGEDKPDANKEYGGINAFEPFRRRETAFLQGLSASDKLTFAISHVCPSQTTANAGDCFDIERDVYGKWNEELARLGVAFMVCGHVHRAYLLKPNDERSLLSHTYPVVYGSACFFEEDFWGAALTLSDGTLTVQFTDSQCRIRETYTVEFDTEIVYKHPE